MAAASPSARPDDGTRSSDWALVTGSSRGIGRAIAERLARSRLHVVLNGRAEGEALSAARAAVEASGGSASVTAFDVTDRPACRAAAESLLAERGAPWAVVHNAGIARDGLFMWMPEADWDDVLETNLTAFYNVTRPLIQSMLRARRGRIVAVTSASGQLGRAGQVSYAASKAGLAGAIRSLARECARRGLTVNAVAPGYVESDMTEDLDAERIAAEVPARRPGRPEEVAAVVDFLVGADASYVTGQVIGVNGGVV